MQEIEMKIKGIELLEKDVKKSGNSGRIYVPVDWVGQKVKVILLKDESKKKSAPKKSNPKKTNILKRKTVGKISLIILFLLLFSNGVSAYNFKNQTELTTATWWPFNSVYGSPGNVWMAGLPKGWPSDTSDSDVIVSLNVSTHMAWTDLTGVPKTQLLDWASKTGQGIDLMDRPIKLYIKSENSYMWSDIYLETYIQNFVTNYSNSSAYRGVNFGDEPYDNGLAENLKALAIVKTKKVYDLFRKYDTDPTHKYYFNTAKGLPEMSLCRGVNPDLLVSSGDGVLREPYIPNFGPEFQANYDIKTKWFDLDYLCTENQGIPFGFSIASANWEGDVDPNEARMTTYLMLAHGGKFVLWFVYGTTYGYVWENNNPSKNSYFTYWSPAFEGGRNSLVTTNISYLIDNDIVHSGKNSLQVNVSGTVPYWWDVFLDPVYGFKISSKKNYTLSMWVKSNCSTCYASVGIAGFAACSPLYGAFDWKKVSCNTTVPATQNYLLYLFITNPGPGNGTVWFDDISLYDMNSSFEMLNNLNPGFETKYGTDRTPQEPSFSITKQLNLEMANLSEIVPLKRFEVSDNYNIPYKSLINSISVSADNGWDIPRLEYGLFTDNDTNGLVYMILVNRIVLDNITANIKINSSSSITITDVVTKQGLGTYPSSSGLVDINFNLEKGEGLVLKMEGLVYNKEIETKPAYSNDFSLGLNDFDANSGYSIQTTDWGPALYGDAVSSLSAINIALKDKKFQDMRIDLDFKIENYDRAKSGGPLFYLSFRQTTLNNLWHSFYAGIQPNYSLSYTDYKSAYSLISLTTATTPWNWSYTNDQNILQDKNWHHLTTKAYGGKLEVYLDDIKYVGANNNNLPNEGYVGISLLQGNSVYFKNFVITNITAAELPGPIDTIKPVISIIHSPENIFPSQTVTFTATATDETKLDNITIFVDDVPVQICYSSPCSYPTSFSTEGVYKYYAIAFDNSSNAAQDPSAFSKSLSVVKNNPPVLSITLAGNPKYTNQLIYLTASATDDYELQSISIYIDDILRRECNTAPVTTCDSFGVFGEGNHGYYAIAYDTFGLSTRYPVTETINFTLIAFSSGCKYSNPSCNNINETCDDILNKCVDFCDPHCCNGEYCDINDLTCKTYYGCDANLPACIEGFSTCYLNSCVLTTRPTVISNYSPQLIGLNQQVTITANASHETGISSIIIELDNVNVTTCLFSDSCTFTTSFSSVGTHYYAAYANNSIKLAKRDPTTKFRNFTVIDFSTLSCNGINLCPTGYSCQNTRCVQNPEQPPDSSSPVLNVLLKGGGSSLLLPIFKGISPSIMIPLQNCSAQKGTVCLQGETCVEGIFKNSTDVGIRCCVSGACSQDAKDFIYPALVSNVSVINVSFNSAQITWQSNVPSTTEIVYGSKSGSYTLSNSYKDNVISHSVILSGLTGGQIYYFKVISCTADGCTKSDEFSFVSISQNKGCAYDNPPCEDGWNCENNECITTIETQQPGNVDFALNNFVQKGTTSYINGFLFTIIIGIIIFVVIFNVVYDTIILSHREKQKADIANTLSLQNPKNEDITQNKTISQELPAEFHVEEKTNDDSEIIKEK